MTALPVRTRFAPSPTGLLHAGNLRTALFNLLLARHCDGEFLLRIEDSDASREQADAVAAIVADLRWLGFDWDTGPSLGQPESAWRQSARRERHADVLRQLLVQGHAYRCFCTPERLAELRAAQQRAGSAPRYDGHCAGLDSHEARARTEAGEPAAIRLRLPAAGHIEFEDVVRGRQAVEARHLGDPVLQRADGSAAFLFANAMDDADAGITHVIRGEDHLSNTPRQIVLLQALGLEPPRYGHVGLVVDAAGAPLSKRRGAPGVESLARDGYRPAAIVNYLARLGSGVESDGLLDIDALAERFEVGRLGRGPARFDLAQLDHWQGLAMADASTAELLEHLGPTPGSAEKRERLVALVRRNLSTMGDLDDWAVRLCDPDLPVLTPDGSPGADASALLAPVREAPAGFFDTVRATLDARAPEDWATLRPALEAATGCRGGRLMKPLRLALTGYAHGPAIGDIIDFMPADTRRARLQRAAAMAAPGAQPDA